MPTRHETPWKPTRQELLAAVGAAIPDLIAPGLAVLFVGINPGLYSAAVRHHFARPGNRFWPALRDGGFTTSVLSPFEERRLLAAGCGITNIASRATAAAIELTADELRAGAVRLEQKVRRFRPRIVAVLGVGAYRTGFGVVSAVVGPQPAHQIGSASIWVLPNPSGLNAHYQAAELGRLFRQLHRAAFGSAQVPPDASG